MYKKAYTESKQSGNFKAFVGALYFTKNHFVTQSLSYSTWDR